METVPTPLEADLLTTEQVAKVFGVHRTTIRRWTEMGLLPALKTTHWYVRYRRQDVEQLLNSGDVRRVNE